MDPHPFGGESRIFVEVIRWRHRLRIDFHVRVADPDPRVIDPAQISVPAPYAARALTAVDAQAVFEVIAADEFDQIGRVAIEVEDIIGDWQRPSFSLADSTIGVFLGDELVGYAEHSGHDRGDAAVHPAHRGRGIGRQLALWMQNKARSRGASVVGMPVPEGGVADRALADWGYRVRLHSWILQLPEGAEIAPRPLPAGYVARAATESDYAAMHDVLEDAFLEWSVRDRESYADFLARTVDRPGRQPWMLRVVTDTEGAVVAAACLVLSDNKECYVDRLATRADQRNRGIAQALLADSFAAGRHNGALTSGLSTDSRTGALGLYEKVGMVVTDNWVNRAIEL